MFAPDGNKEAGKPRRGIRAWLVHRSRNKVGLPNDVTREDLEDRRDLIRAVKGALALQYGQYAASDGLILLVIEEFADDLNGVHEISDIDTPLLERIKTYVRTRGVPRARLGLDDTASDEALQIAQKEDDGRWRNYFGLPSDATDDQLAAGRELYGLVSSYKAGDFSTRLALGNTLPPSLQIQNMLNTQIDLLIRRFCGLHETATNEDIKEKILIFRNSAKKLTGLDKLAFGRCRIIDWWFPEE